MRTHRGGAPAVAVACASLALFGCGGDDAGDAAQAPDRMATTTRADCDLERERDMGGDRGARRDAERQRPGITITTADSQFGRVLFDADRRAIYYFDKERTAEATATEPAPKPGRRSSPTASPEPEAELGETPGHDAARRRQDPGDLRRPAPLLLRRRPTWSAPVPQRQRVRRPLARGATLGRGGLLTHPAAARGDASPHCRTPP